MITNILLVLVIWLLLNALYVVLRMPCRVEGNERDWHQHPD